MEPAAVADTLKRVAEVDGSISGGATGGIAAIIIFSITRIIERLIARRKKSEPKEENSKHICAQHQNILTEKDVENLILKHQQACISCIREEMKEGFREAGEKIETGLRGVHDRLDKFFLANMGSSK